MTTRTLSQNNSHWKYCELMADGLNNTQASVQKVCTLPIAFTKDNFHELIWKPVQHTMFPDIESTTQLDTKQMSEVYEQVNKIISEQWAVQADWPSVENQLNESRICEDYYDDDFCDDSEYCECGVVGVTEEEQASNKCDGCGKLID